MENTFSVMPMSQSINLHAGEVYHGSITVANSADSSKDLNYVVSVAPYSVVGENYDADLATMSNRSMIKNWVKIAEPTGTLAPNESKKIEFVITVPENAPAGGQYMAVTVAEKLLAEDSMVSSVFEIASLVYANVAGETVHEGEILENNIPGFATSTPVTISSLFSNTGNVHQIATINIYVKNVLTGEEILSTDAASGNYNELIMPETERLVSYDVADLPVVGVVEVSQSIKYSGKLSVETKNVVICPLWFITLAAVMLVGVIWGVFKIVKKWRQKKVVA